MPSARPFLTAMVYSLLAFSFYNWGLKFVYLLLPHNCAALAPLAGLVEPQFLNNAVTRFEILAINLIIYCLLTQLLDKQFKADYSLKPSLVNIRYYLMGLLLMLGMAALSLELDKVFKIIFEIKFIGNFHLLSLDVIWVLIFSSFTVIAEELIFRGYIFTKLRSLFKSELANILQALLFGLAHYSSHAHNLMLVPLTMLVGLLFGYGYLLTKSLYICFGMHTAIHLSSVLTSPQFWQITDNSSLQASPLLHLFAADFGLIQTLVMVGLLVIMLLKYKKSLTI